MQCNRDVSSTFVLAKTDKCRTVNIRKIQSKYINLSAKVKVQIFIAK